MSGRRILFVGHQGSRTGAPIMLLHFMRWLRAHTDLGFDLLLVVGGALVEDYRGVCEVFLLPAPDGQPELLSRLAQRDIGLIYSNTVTNGAVLAGLSALQCPVVCHAHEVGSYFRLMGPDEAARIKDSATAFITVTHEGFASLVRHGVAPETITHVPGFLPFGPMRPPDRERGRAFRRQHGIPEDAILVGGCGTLHWQKGPDLLVHVARRLVGRHGPVGGGPASRWFTRLLRRRGSRSLHFVWVGGRSDEPGAIQLQWDVAHADLTDRFTLIPSLADTESYFDSLDIFALTSRNDPLPLVAMEAGVCGIPIVCFAGNAEPVDAESGVVVPYLDLDRFARAIAALAGNPSRRAKLGARLAEKIRAEHDINVVAPRIVDILQRLLRK